MSALTPVPDPFDGITINDVVRFAIALNRPPAELLGEMVRAREARVTGAWPEMDPLPGAGRYAAR